MSKIALFKTKSFQITFLIALAVGIGIAIAVDTDNDGMSDVYENFFVTTQVHATCELSSLELSQTLALSRTKNKFIFIWAQIE